MRKYHKRQCLELIDSLIEAQDKFVNDIKQKRTKDAVALMEQCQQAAISIGMMIDESEGEGTLAVRGLEEYCEQLYQLHKAVLEGKPVNARKMQKSFLQKLLETANSIRNHIRTEYEVVFLPYKASMWDSLESVWREANNDPDCTAVVIPIPYYDKNPDGSFRQKHYEGTQYPADVPVVYYEAYDFENRHPEKIYIHNPYDHGNYVTSVEPFFYSENLKQYTDELIYIPYFCLREIDPDNEEAVKRIENFVMVPAVMNADKIIVQSENMKKAYVRVITKYAGKNTRKYWEERIIGSGSPKITRVMNLKEEDYKLPNEWKSIIKKPDGGQKKIIFYNTCLSALLKHGDIMLDKIESNLRTFHENESDIALLWRPHPLMEATLKSMRPQLWERYKNIVDRYRSEGWGIYDDTAELDRAIAVSDAYYGDRSSVVQLYQTTGKPIMIQNCNMQM